MREYTKLATSVWHSERVKKLEDSGKLAYLYAIGSPHVNSAGYYKLPIGYVMHDLGWNERKVLETLAKIQATGLIKYDQSEQVIFIDKHFQINPPTNPKHAAKVFSDILSIAYTPYKLEVLASFNKCLENQPWDLSEKNRDTLNSLLIGYRYRETERETETETETETLFSNKQSILGHASAAEPPQPKKKGSRLPEGWKASEELGIWAMQQGLDAPTVLREQEKFRNYWHSATGKNAIKLDWDKAFKNWIYNVTERSR